MMSTSKSFPRRLSLNVVCITSVLFILATGAAAIFSHVLIAEEATKSAENLRDATILGIEKTLQNVESAVFNTIWLVDENKVDEEYLYHITYKLVEENPNIIGSSIAFIPNYLEDQYYFAPYSWYDDSVGAIRQRQLGRFLIMLARLGLFASNRKKVFYHPRFERFQSKTCLATPTYHRIQIKCSGFSFQRAGIQHGNHATPYAFFKL